jgi:hypothetical protein
MHYNEIDVQRMGSTVDIVSKTQLSGQSALIEYQNRALQGKLKERIGLK